MTRRNGVESIEVDPNPARERVSVRGFSAALDKWAARVGLPTSRDLYLAAGRVNRWPSRKGGRPC